MPVSSSRFPSAKTALPRPPIHRLPPVQDEDSDAAATRVFDRNSARMSTRTSVSFPAGAFSPPRVPQPFHTEPAIPAAKRAPIPPADDSARTPIQPVLAPTSRRDLRISAFESLAPLAMSAFPSPAPAPTASLSKSSLVAIVLTMIFTLATVAVMGVAIFKPSAIDRAKVAFAGALKAKPPKRVEPVAAKAAEPPPAASVAVPPVLIDNLPADLGEKETALFLPDSAKGHRVFVDGKVLNETDTSASYVIAACGKHKVQVGSTGKEQSLDLPCRGVAHVE
jgi:hypothetical protein